MWHRKILGKLNHRLSLREDADPFSLVYQRGRMECLDPKLFKKLNIARACVTTLEVDLPNLKAYVRLLRWLNAADLKTDQINLKLFEVSRQTVTVETFFRDHLGRYLDSQAEVQAFKTGVLQLLEKFPVIQNEQLGIGGYNARIVKGLLYSAATIADHLRQFSLQ